MILKSLSACLVCLWFLAGCSHFAGVPSAEAFPDASLRKIKSAEHWNVIAGDVVVQTTRLANRADLQGKALYVKPTRDNSDFSRGFQSMLISRLVNGGLSVATRPEGAVQVQYETQVVRHLTRRSCCQTDTMAVLPGGVLVARETSAPVAGAESLRANATPLCPTNTEVIITISLIYGDRFVMRKTDVYYSEDAEGVLFETPYRAQTRIIGVTGE